MSRRFCYVTTLLILGCANPPVVRQEDLNAWVDVPVAALDTHSIFLTFPMVRTVTDSGVEIRNYVNKKGISQCFANTNIAGSANARASASPRTGGGYSLQTNTTSSGNFATFQNCSSQIVGCDNIFYIMNGRVVEYRPTGLCYTNTTAQPQPGWQRFAEPNSNKK